MSVSDSESEYTSSDDSSSQDGSEYSFEITQERLDQLFESAKAAMDRKRREKHATEHSLIADEEDIIIVADSSSKYASSPPYVRRLTLC
jgi:hypothetical protein